MPATITPDGATLEARAHLVEVAPGVRSEVWSLNGGAVGPTIRAQSGDTARLVLRNQLAEPTILHWHGLRVPEQADGHPRQVVGTGQSYRYEFAVNERAGTYWYHAHPHMRTGPQVYRGMAGLFLVSDDEEDALGLPSGSREIPLLIQDRRADQNGQIAYEPVMQEQMDGFFGDTPFGNGIRLPSAPVDTAQYRLRVVNGTNSRIVRLALSNGQPMLLIGNDGGLLPAPVAVLAVDLATGERADLLIDFSQLEVGDRVMLKSAAFSSFSGRGRGRGNFGGMAGAGLPQGAELDLLEFAVTRAVSEATWTPQPFPSIQTIDPATALRTRTFRFESARMNHTINGRAYDMDRVDEHVPFGDTEIWSFVNDRDLPHPVHMHEVHFQLLSREGGRGQLFPWEAGWKDTVLVYPGERVNAIATFDQHRGRFLMHCHNLVHEDMGMMMNYEIV